MSTTITSVSKRLFIPSGIDTRALLGTKAKFADKYNYLLHYLITARAIDQRRTPESYVPVSARVFEKYVTCNHAPNILRFWLEQGVIEYQTNSTGKKSFQAGVSSVAYRFTEAYRQAKIVDVGYYDEKFEKKVARITREFRTSKMDLTIKAHAFLHYNLRELCINAIAAHQTVNKLLAEESSRKRKRTSPRSEFRPSGRRTGSTSSIPWPDAFTTTLLP